MSLGSVLIKPQPLTLPPAPAADPAEILTDLVEALFRDPHAAVAALPVIRDAVGTSFETLAASYLERAKLADGRIRNVFQPFGGVLDAFVAGLGDNVLDSVPAVLKALDGLIVQLTSEQVTGMVRKIADIVEHDLGISRAAVTDFFTDLITRIVNALKKRFLEGDVSDEAVALHEIGSSLDGLLLLLTGELNLPPIDVEVVVKAIGRLWKDANIDGVLKGLHQVLSNLGDLVPAVQVLLEIKLDVNVAVHPIAAAGDPTDGEEEEEEPIAWYASWVAGKTVRYSADTSQSENLFKNPYLEGFTYKHESLSRETMEKIAFHTAWIFPEVEAVLFHVTSMEQGDVLSNLNSVVLNLTEASLVGNCKCRVPGWVQWAVWPFTTIIPWGWEAGWTRLGEAYPWVNAAGDLAEIVLYRRWVWHLRELLLSILTLLNHDPAAEQDLDNPLARNVNCVDGVCHALGELVSMVLPLILSEVDRAKYGFIGNGPTGDMIGKAFAGTLMTATGYLLGLPIAYGLAGERFTDNSRVGRMLLRERMFGEYEFPDFWSGLWTVARALAAVFSYLVDQLIYLYLFTDGNTDGGEWCLDPNGQERHRFTGYKDPQDSPYKLPFAGGQKQCVQGNMGIWSHYPEGNQAYAYDFSHDIGDEVLCSRDGIVVGIDDTTKNKDRAAWNYVTVLHLALDPGGEALAPLAAGIPDPGWPAATTTAAAAIGAASLAVDNAANLPASGQAIAGGQLLSYSGKTATSLTGIPASGAGSITAQIASGSKVIVPVFADGVTAIPASTLFPPYWDATGKLRLKNLSGSSVVDYLPPLHPSACYMVSRAGLPDYYTGAWGFQPTDKVRFLDPKHDRAAKDPAQPDGPGVVALKGGATTPLVATYADYGHGMNMFMRASEAVAAKAEHTPDRTMVDIYKSREAKKVLGLFVRQGQVIMLADSTGNSAYNHLHTHVLGMKDQTWSLPFVYQDCEHTIVHGLREGTRGNGVPRAFTFYDSKNQRIAPYA